jgi:hypothetical protein
MSDIGSSVTLIFYKIGNDWYRGGEPLLNLIAAAAQGSVFTHIEIAIGETPGDGGRMSNVLRVFNDAIGVVRLQSFLTVSFQLLKHSHLSSIHSLNRKSQNAPVSTQATATCNWGAQRDKNRRCSTLQRPKLENRFPNLEWQGLSFGHANPMASLGKFAHVRNVSKPFQNI